MKNRDATVPQVAAVLGVPTWFVHNSVRNGLFLSAQDELGTHHLCIAECQWAYRYFLEGQKKLGSNCSTKALSKVRKAVIAERDRIIAEFGDFIIQEDGEEVHPSFKVDLLLVVGTILVSVLIVVGLFFLLKTVLS